MAPEIKLVVSDIDGTVANYDGTISDNVKNVIKKVSDKGVKVVLATGRMYSAAKPIIDRLGVTTPIICYQGAIIQDANKIYWSQLMDRELAKELVADLKQRNIHINLYQNGNLYVENYNQYVKDYVGTRNISYFKVNNFNDILQNDDVAKIIIIENDKEKLLKVRDEMKTKYSDRLHIVKSLDIYCEFTNPQADKCNAIRYLAQEWGIDLENVLAIGDYDNDADMLKIAGIAVAMGNGSDAVKAVANYITDDVKDDGFVTAMEKFVL